MLLSDIVLSFSNVRESCSLDQLLKSHALNVAAVAEFSEDRQTITVRRRHIWIDTKRALRRPHILD